MPSLRATGSPLSNVSGLVSTGRAWLNVSARRQPCCAETTAIAVLSYPADIEITGS